MLSRSRRQIEPYLQRAKDDPGSDHLEGRAQAGSHYHLALPAPTAPGLFTVHASPKKIGSDVGEDPPGDPAVAGESVGFCVCATGKS